MSDNYTGVTFVTIRVQSDIKRTEDGAQVRLKDELKWQADTTVFYAPGQPQITQEALQIIGNLLARTIAEKFASIPPMPEGVEAVNKPTDVLFDQ